MRPASPKARALRALRPTEKQVQAAVRRLLAMVGCAVWDTSQPFRAAITPGVPDLIVFHPRRGLFFVEVKRPGGRVSDAQRAFAQHCRDAGVAYVLGGVDEVLTFLNAAKPPASPITLTPAAGGEG